MPAPGGTRKAYRVCARPQSRDGGVRGLSATSVPRSRRSPPSLIARHSKFACEQESARRQGDGVRTDYSSTVTPELFYRICKSKGDATQAEGP
ncbi:hypothetical protein SKAU_G00054900 [Synaphobranchus kaupii]|uniref:Uncharacterized protein n=1 Tax=Synaphobranchus kaupii TaxID=118154 RepID=A0A9Q1JA56_SYNKA|nr:hypothetical protein SKAU_G00054900 [Synaphobranchus kaupii]